MKLTLSEQIMYSTLQIEMLDKNSRVTGHASGFIFNFCRDDNQNLAAPMLVTNRHVLAQCCKIRVVFTRAKQDGSPDAGHLIPVALETSPSIFHPSAKVDLAILPLAPSLNLLKMTGQTPFYRTLDITLIPKPDVWKNFDAVEDVIMVGYPKGLRDTVNNLPIFRRGITATHPAFNYQGAPEFMVDMACFPGSSGSPIFLLNEGTYLDKRNNHLAIGKTRVYLLGIQFAVPDIKELGSVISLPSADPKTAAVVQTYINLGVIIKSTELLAFETILQSMTHK